MPEAKALNDGAASVDSADVLVWNAQDRRCFLGAHTCSTLKVHLTPQLLRVNSMMRAAASGNSFPQQNPEGGHFGMPRAKPAPEYFELGGMHAARISVGLVAVVLAFSLRLALAEFVQVWP